MAQLFVSYARENKAAIDALVGNFGVLGHQTWVDSSLRGGDDWWAEILRRIAACDIFIVAVSRASLTSEACRRELDWAEDLRRPIVPVSVEPLPTALPRRLSTRQIIDYTTLDHAAALRLAGALGAAPPAPPLPEPLPQAPEVPLSYLTDLLDLVSSPAAMDHPDQWQIISRVEAALRSVDPEERSGGRDIVDRLMARRDLYADVDRALQQLNSVHNERGPDSESESAPTEGPTEAPSARVATPTSPAAPKVLPATVVEAAAPIHGPSASPRREPKSKVSRDEAPIGEPRSSDATLDLTPLRSASWGFAALGVVGALVVITYLTGLQNYERLRPTPTAYDVPNYPALYPVIPIDIALVIALVLLAVRGHSVPALQKMAAIAWSAAALAIILTVTNLATGWGNRDSESWAPVEIAMATSMAVIALGIVMARLVRARWPWLIVAAAAFWMFDCLMLFVTFNWYSLHWFPFNLLRAGWGLWPLPVLAFALAMHRASRSA
jgi:hypothetical protein